MSEIDERSRELIKTRILNKLKEIKSFPQFVVETLRKLNDPASNASDVATSLSRDEGLVLRTLKLANSAAYGMSRNISDISEAIALLGYKNISNIVLAATVYSVMDKGLSGYALDRGDLWRHSLTTAYTARYIAQATKKIPPEEAYVGGLLHDIGKVVLNDYVRFGYGIILKLVEEEHVPFIEAEVRVLGFDHSVVGSLLVERWDLPEAYFYSTLLHHKPNDLPPEKIKYQSVVDTVNVANSMCLMMGIGIGADGLQNYMYPEPLERLGIRDYEVLMSELVDFAGQAAQEMADMREL
ncbi:MAG: HDOD domain-containing protein [Synergistaceae bacterium]|jgi:putative nucleotidyltransferase with HDIG domain|nr:HDOD domain-containing protein [Synergistaceae bacterium]